MSERVRFDRCGTGVIEKSFGENESLVAANLSLDWNHRHTCVLSSYVAVYRVDTVVHTTCSVHNASLSDELPEPADSCECTSDERVLGSVA